MLRQAAVAGSFYDSNAGDLRKTIDACFLGQYGPGYIPEPASTVTRNIVGLVCPHAGYQYSGYAAASAFCSLAQDGLPEVAVLIGPNHRGIGEPAAIMTEGTWRTPLGDAEVDSDVAMAIIGASSLLRADPTAHIYEHSIEVQLPFLQRLGAKTKIVPIVLSILEWDNAGEYAEDLGRAIANALKGKNGIVIASTDFSHYVPMDLARQKDRLAIAAVEALDYLGLLEVVRRMNISMCGAVPTAIAIIASRELGAIKAELLSYYTSGDIIGDKAQVVGYGALKFVVESSEDRTGKI